MSGVIVTNPPKAELKDVDALAGFGVATVSEAMGRTGLLGPGIRPVQQGVRVAGTAVTVLSWPGDNLMIHAAVEQCGEGDILVVTTTSPSTDGLFGELFATALQRRGVRGLVINNGVRDTQELRDMGFPAWSRAVSAQGTVKATGGSVNVPVAIDGQVVHPGDVILADDDGVVIVPGDAPARRSRRRRPARPRRPPPAPPSWTANSAWTATGCGRRSYGWMWSTSRTTSTSVTTAAAHCETVNGHDAASRRGPLHADARRHLQGRLLPGRGPARRTRRPRRPAPTRHGQPGRAADRRAGRRAPPHQQGRRGVPLVRSTGRRRLPVPPGRRRSTRSERPSELREHPRRSRPVRRGARARPGGGGGDLRADPHGQLRRSRDGNLPDPRRPGRVHRRRRDLRRARHRRSRGDRVPARCREAAAHGQGPRHAGRHDGDLRGQRHADRTDHRHVPRRHRLRDAQGPGGGPDPRPPAPRTPAWRQAT